MKHFHLDAKQKKTACGVVTAVLVVAAGLFCLFGPTETHVNSLAKEENATGLVNFIHDRADSDYFANATEKATEALLGLNGKQESDEMKMIGNLLIADTTQPAQKNAIIVAFTHKDRLVPEFYKVYESNPNLRYVLQENGLRVSPDIFRKKLLAELDWILEQSRKENKDYSKEIETAKIWNVNGEADEAVFTNVKAITKMYAMQSIVQNGDDHKLLLGFADLENKADSSFVSMNKAYFEKLASHTNAKLEAKKRLSVLTEQMRQLQYEKAAEMMNREIAEIQNKMNSYLYLKYWISGVTNGRLRIYGRDQQDREIEATIFKPDRPYKNMTVYHDYFVIVKNEYKEGFFGYVNTPVLQRVDVTGETDRLNQLKIKKNALDKEKQAKERELKRINEELSFHDKEIRERLRSGLNKLEKITGSDLLHFSKDDSKAVKL